MEAIANKDDVSAIYYFLGKNPNLCDPKMWTDNNNNSTSEEMADVMEFYGVRAEAVAGKNK